MKGDFPMCEKTFIEDGERVLRCPIPTYGQIANLQIAKRRMTRSLSSALGWKMFAQRETATVHH